MQKKDDRWLKNERLGLCPGQLQEQVPPITPNWLIKCRCEQRTHTIRRECAGLIIWGSVKTPLTTVAALIVRFQWWTEPCLQWRAVVVGPLCNLGRCAVNLRWLTLTRSKPGQQIWKSRVKENLNPVILESRTETMSFCGFCAKGKMRNFGKWVGQAL